MHELLPSGHLQTPMRGLLSTRYKARRLIWYFLKCSCNKGCGRAQASTTAVWRLGIIHPARSAGRSLGFYTVVTYIPTKSSVSKTFLQTHLSYRTSEEAITRSRHSWVGPAHWLLPSLLQTQLAAILQAFLGILKRLFLLRYSSSFSDSPF